MKPKNGHNHEEPCGVGGFCRGDYCGSVVDSYVSNSSVSAEHEAGGLIGWITSGVVSNSFYNADATLINGSLGVVTIGGIYANQWGDWARTKKIEASDYFGAADIDGFYSIQSIDDFRNLLGVIDQAGLKYKLVSDIDLAGYGGLWLPYFAGLEFDGLGHIVRNLSLQQSSSWMGLFGLVEGGIIKNLNVFDARINTLRQSIGVLVGRSDGATVSGCKVQGAFIQGAAIVGGLVGDRGGLYVNGVWATPVSTIIDSHVVDSTVQGGVYVGGLAGRAHTIKDSSVSGCTVIGSNEGLGDGTVSAIGGLVGSGGSTLNSYVSDSTVKGGDATGGLVGGGLGSINNCYVRNITVQGVNNVGGLTGGNPNKTYVTMSIDDSHVESSHITGVNSVGGLAGWSNSPISNSYVSMGSVQASGYIGGLIGENNGSVSNSFYNIETLPINGNTGVVTLGGIYGTQWNTWITDRQLQADAYFGPADAGGYFLIDTVDEFKDFLGVLDQAGLKFKLGADLDLSGAHGLWLPQLSVAEFDGQGHTVRNVSVNLPVSRLGLIGTVNAGAVVRALGASGVSVSSPGTVGALVGMNAGSVEGSFAIADAVNGGVSTGGLIGTNAGSVARTYAVVTSMTTGDGMGGLVGINKGSVSESYASSGLVGYNEGLVTSSYWNQESSVLAYSDGGDPLNPMQMKQFASYPGWGFANTWRIYEGRSYPLLRSFLTPATVTANNATKTVDGIPYTGGDGVTCSPGPCSNAGYLGTVSYGGTSQGATAIGGYSIVPSGLYSNQTGYDITYANGTLTIGAATSYTGQSPTQPAHNLTAGFTGGGAGCTLTQSSFTAPPAAPPEGVTFPHGVFNFTASGCQTGSTLAVTVSYPQALPAGAQYWKYINGSWQTISATINGASVTFNITDNGPLDADGAAGVIRDPGGVGIRAADPGTAQSIPTLSKWGLLLLSGLLGLAAYARVGRQAGLA